MRVSRSRVPLPLQFSDTANGLRSVMAALPVFRRCG